GTDEHGTTTEAKAIEEGITPKQLTDKYFKIHKEIYDWFNLEFDCFGRTSSKANKEITIDIFNKLYDNGYIFEDEIEQAFCIKCNKFLADRFVEGRCPKCDYEHARGDQCEQCGALLDPVELLEPRCKFCGIAPEIKRTKHLFIDLPKLEPELMKWIDEKKATWSQNAVTLTMAWIKQGLKPRCITRDLKWGIPVPTKGYENKVFYSWFDAPIGYIGITKECKKNWKNLWKNPDDVKLVQFMGKDNIPFHTILFPSFLIGTKDNYTLMDQISSNEYLNYENGQFSKSRGLGVFGDDAQKTGIPADVWRYYILINRPEKTDTEFHWKDFQMKINNELVANLGNLVNRTVTFVNKFFDAKIPKGELNENDNKFLDELKKVKENITGFMEKVEIKEALREIMHFSKLCNHYFQENEPWKKFKEDKERAATSLFVLTNVVKDLSILIEPYMPDIADKICSLLKIKKKKWDDICEFSLKNGHEIAKPEIIFNKLEDAELEKLQEEFSGKKIQDAFSLLDLRVAKIKKIKDHPKADKLYIMKIDIGELGERQIVAGIRPYYKKTELENRNTIIVANLKPAMLRGELSKGMLLAADDGKNVRLLDVPKSKPGDKVFVEDIISEPKKEIEFEEFMKAEMKTKKGKVLHKGKKLKTETEEVAVKDVGDDASVR
ncbi:methionine--tRNA ligase, partial [Candidatus Woesearchaeota archaeon]|nr:methionine--tRNA ligase [Candidatus Woesearchaeota archaeon]